jgi:hypothetical protein
VSDVLEEEEEDSFQAQPRPARVLVPPIVVPLTLKEAMDVEFASLGTFEYACKWVFSVKYNL